MLVALVEASHNEVYYVNWIENVPDAGQQAHNEKVQNGCSSTVSATQNKNKQFESNQTSTKPLFYLIPLPDANNNHHNDNKS